MHRGLRNEVLIRANQLSLKLNPSSSASTSIFLASSRPPLPRLVTPQDSDSHLHTASPFAMNASSSALIQSLSIPSHSTRTTPPPSHVVYNIQINTPTHSYSIAHRYSSFVALHESLTATLRSPPPGALPAKRAASWSLSSLVGMTPVLSPAQLVERRTGLEGWLRGLLSSKDARWAASSAFRAFLAAPPESAGSRREFTTSTWMMEHGELVTVGRTLRGQFAKRDALILQKDAGAHAVNLEAKRELVEFVRRIGGLGEGLKGLAKSGMVQGELQRRGDMVGKLQDDAETLGRTAATAPRPPTSHTRDSDAPPAARAALLNLPAHKAPSRVLGAARPGRETNETRPLDNAGLMQLQANYVAEQDSKLDSLTAVLRRQRELGIMISDELAVHSELLDVIDKGTDKVQASLKDAGKQLKRLG
jgi:regulator of vacuolar morphogenesis